MISLIRVDKKGDERPEVLIRRFNREVQQSGIMTTAKKNRYYEKDLNRGLRRKSAIRRNSIASIKRGY